MLDPAEDLLPRRVEAPGRLGRLAAGHDRERIGGQPQEELLP
jgi:hypothetical protein